MRPSLRFALGAAFVPVVAFGLVSASTAGVIAQGGVEVAILPATTAAVGPDINVDLDVEARTDAAARRLGFRSLHVVASVDCRLRANRVAEAESYARPALKGVGQAQPVGAQWVNPQAASFMAAVTTKVCAGPPAPPAPAAFVRPLPIVVITASRPATHAVATPTAASFAVASPPSPTTGPQAPAAVALQGGFGAVAQVAASPNSADARRVLAALGPLVEPPLAGAVEPVLVRGARAYRASIVGFASIEAAQAFCAKAAGVAKDCWVRPAAPRPPKL